MTKTRPFKADFRELPYGARQYEAFYGYPFQAETANSVAVSGSRPLSERVSGQAWRIKVVPRAVVLFRAAFFMERSAGKMFKQHVFVNVY